MTGKRLASLALAVLLIFSMIPSSAADGGTVYKMKTRVEGSSSETELRAFDADADGNIFVSLKSLAVALAKSSKKYIISFEKNETNGEHYVITSGKAPAETTLPDIYSVNSSESFKNRLFVDGKEKKYGTYRADSDLYMNLTDIQLLFDITAEFDSDGLLRIYPDKPFQPDLDELLDADFFAGLNAVLLGDADTGEILFSFSRLRPAPIASLSKLMTYLLVAEAEQRGEISYNDMVKVTPEAAAISHSPTEGTIWVEEGLEVPMDEVLKALLVASSNESAVMLAQHVCGTTGAFVDRMNERAEELGLRYAVFYNPNGLPVYMGGAVAAKTQNRMSAADMFVLVSYILKNFPQITEIASLQYCELPTMEYKQYNTNHSLFNLEGTVGLKTGFTNKAGSCVVTVLPVKCDGEEHNMVAIVLGAETSSERNRAADILLRSCLY